MNVTTRPNKYTVLLLLFLLAVLLLGLAMSALRHFDGLYGQDAFAYYEYATGPLRESMPGTLPPFFWPPGYPLLVLLMSFLVGTDPLAGQLVSLLAGMLAPLFTAFLAREVWPETRSPWLAPLVAGLLVAFAGQLWQSSVVVMTDTTGLAAVTLGMWALARYGRDDQEPRAIFWLLLAAAAMAFAVLTRWAFALIALPATAYALVILFGRPRATAAGHALAAAIIVLLVLSPVLGPVIHFLGGTTGGQASFVVDLEVVTWSPLNALRRDFVNSDGYLHYRWPNGLYYALTPAHRYYFTPWLAPLLLPGLWAVLRRRTTAQLLLLLGWAGVVYAFLAGIPWQNFRFTLTYLPPLAILAAIGFATVWRWLPGRLNWLLLPYLLAGLGLMGWGGAQLTGDFITRKEADLQTVAWVEGRTPASARLLTFGVTLTFQHYSHLETLELYSLTPADLEVLVADDRPTFLLLDVANIESQWSGRSPETNFRWLREGPGLVEVGVQRSFTLFRVVKE
jgi:4-amino-4-deoxy-L-arabinose transferase-like glycosyltransferase